MKVLDRIVEKWVKPGVKHPNIDGKEVVIANKKILIEREFLYDELLDTPFTRMNWAMVNFFKRRPDLTSADGKKKIYYGHIQQGEVWLGYLVAEDELTDEAPVEVKSLRHPLVAAFLRRKIK